MRKSNPLFTDTTRSTGDAIFANVELSGVPAPFDGEIFIRVIDNQTQEMTAKLAKDEDSGSYKGKILVRHRDHLTISFFSKRDELYIQTTEPKPIEASYQISETWMPMEVEAVMTSEAASAAAIAAASSDIDTDVLELQR